MGLGRVNRSSPAPQRGRIAEMALMLGSQKAAVAPTLRLGNRSRYLHNFQNDRQLRGSTSGNAHTKEEVQLGAVGR